ncbi:olfactory receptor 1P1-like [Trichosurus vulpecula]|uniref:olfactory receptor 1P1-like n=1 Tax=Trichosurus vulpecula TaxID=9337 RepID=UPI00186B0682|nr:olfactory receptor 1P1-like [Trichosurus vulpecula]
MDEGNQSHLYEFILQGLSEQSAHQWIWFTLFFWLYLVALTGNLLISMAILLDGHLHKPMYFFLAHLSLADACFVSTTVPNLLVNIGTHDRSISYPRCMTQLYFFLTFGDLDIFLLAVMAYDRYVAICYPLHYATALGPTHCAFLVVICWLLTSLVAITHTLLTARLSFCTPKPIPGFFCDLGPLMQVSCSDTQANMLVLLTLGGAVILIPFILILVSYTHIALAIFRTPSAQGRHKAFSTCGSHLTVVFLFFGTVIRAYLCPTDPGSAAAGDTVAIVMYTVITPTVNPFIYSLRNRDMQTALARLILGKTLRRKAR